MGRRDQTSVWRPLTGEGQTVAYTATAGTIANAFAAQTYAVWVWATTAAHVQVGTSPTATTSDPSIPANTLVTIQVHPGEKLSAVQVSAGGNVYVGELSH